MIKVYCHTNLDDVGREDWPTELPEVPRVGDEIESGTLHKSSNIVAQGIRVRLKVTSITWECIDNGAYGTRHVWRPCVELHLPSNFKSVNHFQCWYDHIRGRIPTEIYQRRVSEVNT